LLRTDYNFGFALFFYLIWTIKRDPQIAQLLVFGLAALVVTDLLWFITVASSWTTVDESNSAWSSLRSGHLWVIFLSVLNVALKVIAAGILYIVRKNPDESSQSMLDQPNY